MSCRIKFAFKKQDCICLVVTRSIAICLFFVSELLVLIYTGREFMINSESLDTFCWPGFTELF
jgi:hypothetical protein